MRAGPAWPQSASTVSLCAAESDFLQTAVRRLGEKRLWPPTGESNPGYPITSTLQLQSRGLATVSLRRKGKYFWRDKAKDLAGLASPSWPDFSLSQPRTHGLPVA